MSSESDHKKRVEISEIEFLRYMNKPLYERLKNILAHQNSILSRFKTESGTRYKRGPLPWGHSVDKNGILHKNPNYDNIIKHIVSSYRAGRSLRKISKMLAEVYGISLTYEGVRLVLKNTVKTTFNR